MNLVFEAKQKENLKHLTFRLKYFYYINIKLDKNK